MMREIWRDSIYPGYKVSDFGNIYSVKTKRKMHPYSKHGHATVKIQGKEIRLARIIYASFKGPIPEGHSVIHRNLNKMDCDLSNLICCSKKKGGKITGHLSKRKKVALYRNGRLYKIYRSARAAALDLGIGRQSLSDLLNGKIKYPNRMKANADVRWYE